MTLLAVRNQLIRILTRQDTIDAASDFVGIELEQGLEPFREQVIQGALGELAEAGMVRQISGGIWILTAPLGLAGQDLHLSLRTSCELAEEVNAYIDANDLQGEWPPVNPLNVTEDDILKLLGVVSDLRSDDLEDEPEGTTGPN